MGKKRTKASESVATPSGKRPAGRRQVEKLDREILRLLKARFDLSPPSGRGGSSSNYLLDELADIERLAEKVGVPADEIRPIYREILSRSLAHAKPMRVAFLGPEFTYSHLATIERFGQSAVQIPVATIAAAFEEVERGQVDYAVVPIENSTDGRVADALECLAKSPVQICGEIPLRIRHCLLANCERSEIQNVYSKRQPLSQCRNWLSQHLAHANLCEVASSAEAALKAAHEPYAAAIASEQAGVNHGVQVLAKSIEDNSDNVTRFAVIGLHSGEKTGDDKTSIVFEIDHKPGALADSMGIFKRQKLNMTWIESFPLPGQRGRYLFFVEFQGHQSELRVRRALGSLGKRSLRLTVLGSYAQASPIG